MMIRERKNPKILVIPLRFIGDTVLTVPLIRNLRYHYPDAVLDVLASEAAASLLEPCPYIDHVLIEPESALESFILLLKHRYDEIYILRKSITTAALARLSGARRLIGYDKQRWMRPVDFKRWGFLLDAKAVYPSLRTKTHQALSHLNLLAANGVPIRDDYLELWKTAEDDTSLKAKLRELKVEFSRPVAIIHSVSASEGKTFDIEKFTEPAKLLYHKGYQLICTGTPGDAARYDTLRTKIGMPLINLAGKTTLREMFSLYQMAEFILTVDSSPIHIAAAAGIPRIVGLFGPTNEKQWGPHRHVAGHSKFWPVFMELPCRPCYAKICEHNSCRLQMDGNQICKAIYQALSEAGA